MSIYQLLPPLSADEYAALKADIAKRGVMVPVETDEAGAILDGHHRSAIASELGIDCPTIVRVGLSETDKREHVLKLNLLRRQLGPIAWAETFRRMVEVRGVRLGQGARNDRTSDTLSEVTASSWRHGADRARLNEIVAELGVSTRTARRRVRLADALAEHPDLAEQVDAGELEARRAERIVRDRAAEATRAAMKAAPPALLPTGDNSGAEYWVGPPSVRCEIRAFAKALPPITAFAMDDPARRPPLSDDARRAPGVAEALAAAEEAVALGRQELSDAQDALIKARVYADRRLAAAVRRLNKVAETADATEVPGGPEVPGSRTGWANPPMPPHRTHCHEPVTISGWVRSGGWTRWGNEVLA